MIEAVACALRVFSIGPEQIGNIIGSSTVPAPLQEIGEQRLGLAGGSARRISIHLATVVAIDAQPAEAADFSNDRGCQDRPRPALPLIDVATTLGPRPRLRA